MHTPICPVIAKPVGDSSRSSSGRKTCKHSSNCETLVSFVISTFQLSNNLPTNNHNRDQLCIQLTLSPLCLGKLLPPGEYQLAYRSDKLYRLNVWTVKFIPFSDTFSNTNRSPSGSDGSDATVRIFGRSIRQLLSISPSIKGKK